MDCSPKQGPASCTSVSQLLSARRIAEGGEVLGLSAAVSGRSYIVTAETLVPCQVNFIKRDDFLLFLKENSAASLRVAEHLSNNYNNAFEQVRSLGLSHSASERLAKLMLGWCAKDGKDTAAGTDVKLTLTHEEMAQLIGASRETVTRLLAEFKRKELISIKGSTLLIRDKPKMVAMVTS